MKKFLLTISALALTTAMAQASGGMPPTPVPGTTPIDPNTSGGPVFDAWMDNAEFHTPVPPFDHNDPTPPGQVEVLKPDPLEIPMRMYKGCGPLGQCAYVDQVGDGNDVNIDQSNATPGSIADVIQVGDDNAASILQLGGSGPHYGVVTQQGDNNGAAIRQSSDIVTGATYADIQQGGDGTNGGGNTLAFNNWASIDQGVDGAGNPVASYGNKAQIRQEGVSFGVAADNEAAIIQRGDNMRSQIEQDGLINQASILQTGDGGFANSGDFEDNEARITQVGVGNLGAIFQDGQFQLASIDQNGDFNNASIQQDGIEFGNGNTALIDQDGDFNNSSIMQTGDGNMASNTQDGSFNWSSIWQEGDGNMADATQTADNNYSAIEQLGDNNIAGVLQNGNDWADIQQNGTGNIATVLQQ